ncbi:MAG: hypothetical protein CVV46_06200 [Spirochaetae bacterium HGW-Spirochaetae-2]|nr:MAG: hypothetical protein CVV46_06200 [Spirochaetae bacterium HGW-Spirochaetae-2]
MPLAYKDLDDPKFVYQALLGYGLFADMLPPCFQSEQLYNYLASKVPRRYRPHYYVEYRATRNVNTPRVLAIPHPESYWALCHFLSAKWLLVNEFIGQVPQKFNFCHVRRKKNTNSIFDMNYKGSDRWDEEEIKINHSLGCKYIAIADISNCFGSIYTHSIPWAVNGIEQAKNSHKSSLNFPKKSGKTKYRVLDSSGYLDENWGNDLDILVRNIQDAQTNGLLIGPHPYNIIAELILTRIDIQLSRKGFMNVTRYIDDYHYYAKDETDAQKFIKCLELELKKFELTLNSKKTRIELFKDFSNDDWIGKLSRFPFPTLFPEQKGIGFTSISSFIDFALDLANEKGNYSVLNVAIKIVSKKKLSDRARKLYILRILQLSLLYPYLLPYLEEHVFKFTDDYGFLERFLPSLFRQGQLSGNSDSLSYVFYFAIKFGIRMEINNGDIDSILNADDCILLVLAYRYGNYSQNNELMDKIKQYALSINNLPDDRIRDKYWMLLYEVLDASLLYCDFLKELKKKNISFWR